MSSNDDFLVAFGQGTTALLAVAAAALTFLAGRAVARTRAGDPVYSLHLIAIVVIGVYALASDALSWWAWCQTAARPQEFLFGWSASAWLSLIFAPPAVFSGVCVAYYGGLLVVRVRRDLKGRWRA
jgi:hypothetical protein